MKGEPGSNFARYGEDDDGQHRCEGQDALDSGDAVGKGLGTGGRARAEVFRMLNMCLQAFLFKCGPDPTTHSKSTCSNTGADNDQKPESCKETPVFLIGRLSVDQEDHP